LKRISFQFLYAFVLGVIASFGFAPFSFWFAPIFAMYFLYNLLSRSIGLSAAIISFLFGLGLLLPVQHWTGEYVGNTPWLALCLMQSFLFLPLILVGRKRNFLNATLFGLIFIFIEHLLKSIPFGGFGWSRIGFTQVDSPFKSLYPIVGTVGIVFTLAFFAANRKPIITLAVILILIALPSLDRSLKTGPVTRIALVQGGVQRLGFDFNATPRQVFQNHLDATKRDLKPRQVDLIIWPENAVDVDIFANKDVKDQIVSLSQQLQTPILIGGISKYSGALQNISVLFNPNVIQLYTKRYLTPFGEYIPLRDWVSRVSSLTDQVEDFHPGVADNQIFLGKSNFQIFICYELLSDKFTNQIDSDFIVVQTNNATFGDTSQLAQEQNIARVRALESGRDVAYVSTTGITSFISSNGKIESVLPKFENGTLIGQVASANGRNLNQYFGVYLEWFAIGMLFLIITLRRKVQN
jgi:apolipoprotein N-acyltransferase